MKTIGKRKEPEITFHATAENLKKGLSFNNTINKFFQNKLYIPKGVYHYKTHKEANEHWNKYIVLGIIERQKEIKLNERKNFKTGNN